MMEAMERIRKNNPHYRASTSILHEYLWDTDAVVREIFVKFMSGLWSRMFACVWVCAAL